MPEAAGKTGQRFEGEGKVLDISVGADRSPRMEMQSRSWASSVPWVHAGSRAAGEEVLDVLAAG